MFWSIVLPTLLFLLLTAGLEIGRLLGRRYRGGGEDAVGSAAADGVVFAVLGLLVAFTFTESASRFNDRRQLIVDQANALGTAWLRLDVLPEQDRSAIQQSMERWVDIALDLTKLTQESEQAVAEALAEAQRLQTESWTLATKAAQRHANPSVTPFVLAPLNDWIDLSTKRIEMDNMGMPPLVMPTLIALSFVGSLLAGFGMSKRTIRSPLHMISFAAVLAFSMYVILDLEHPRQGLIRVDAVDNAMVQLRAGFRAQPASTFPDQVN